HLITATDGLNVLEVPITIESVPPTLPTISSPGAGSRVKAPVTFTWSPVTDPSAPVTYELQIATAGTFAEGTVIISKPLLTTATYELTETEQAIISARDITYYWRVRATDAASNSGAWTAGANFAIAPPFKFTGWPLYLTMGIGAVLVFCIGYLLGRRTAFRF
ncbi:MAG: hypothetical protein JW969_12725, partial [Spirochaetales bacterium]|nr:hypothetical protein [Spirochaetales bacterium]